MWIKAQARAKKCKRSKMTRFRSRSSCHSSRSTSHSFRFSPSPSSCSMYHSSRSYYAVTAHYCFWTERGPAKNSPAKLQAVSRVKRNGRVPHQKATSVTGAGLGGALKPQLWSYDPTFLKTFLINKYRALPPSLPRSPSHALTLALSLSLLSSLSLSLPLPPSLSL